MSSLVWRFFNILRYWALTILRYWALTSFLVQRLASTFQKYNNGLVPLKMKEQSRCLIFSIHRPLNNEQFIF